MLAHRLRHRSLTGELLAADKQALQASARAAQLDRRQQIEVSFEQPASPADGQDTREERSRGESSR